MAETSPAGGAPASSPRTDEQDAGISTSETGKPPLLAFAMLKRAIGDGIFSLDSNQLSAQIYAGVLLNLKDGEGQGPPYTHIYRVDKELNKSCWMILAKGLSINGGDDYTLWEWEEDEVSCYPDKVKVPVAELSSISHLDISGKCNTIMLSPWTTYKVEIIVKMSSENKNGWNVPVNLTLALPDGNKLERMEKLDELKEEPWTCISIGEFETTPKTVGNISFSLRQTGSHDKSGLCVKAIVIRPTEETSSQR